MPVVLPHDFSSSSVSTSSIPLGTRIGALRDDPSPSSCGVGLGGLLEGLAGETGEELEEGFSRDKKPNNMSASV
jgi:hypothetical protein